MSDLRAGIDAANQEFMAAFGRQDASGMAGLYTAGGQLLPTNSDFVTGTDSIRAFWQGAFDMGLKQAVLDTVELDGRGDTAIEVGRYRLLTAGDAVADEGKYIVIWKRDAGAWKLHRDVWNTSRPAA